MKKIKRSVLYLLLVQALILLLAMAAFVRERKNLYRETMTFGDFAFTADQGARQEQYSLPLKKGTYIVYFNYNTDTSDNVISVSSPELNGLSLRCSPLTLEPTSLTKSLTMELERDTKELDINFEYSGEGFWAISELTVMQTNSPGKRRIVYAVLLCALLALLCYFVQANTTVRKSMLALAGIFLAASYPVFSDYLIPGHDILFHTMRIDGIYLGLMQGDFPVKIHPLWAEGYGYAVGIFYGNLFLYFPAFLRIMGFSVQNAYKGYILAVNLGTVLISYRCFKKMFKNTGIGLTGSLLYTMSAYRLCDLYTRSAVGEYTALMFLPLILYGFYLIFTDTDIRKNWLRHGITVAVGLTGLMQSHILSGEMAAIFIILTCIILIKKVIRPHVFLSLASGAVLTLLLNLGFLVPFLNYFNDILINSSDWGSHIDYTIQNRGMFPTQIFGFIQRFYGGDMTTASGTGFEPAAAPGIALVLCMGLFLYVLGCCRPKTEEIKAPLLCFVLGCLSLWMSTCYFPWDAIASTSYIVKHQVVSLEFPWRFVSVSTILLTFSACYTVSALQKYISSNVFPALCGGLLVLLAVNSGWYYYDVGLNVEPYRVYDTYELCTMAMYSCDFLPAGTDFDLILPGRIISPEDGSFSDYYKDGTRINVHVQTGPGGGSFDFPLNYYRDYHCTDHTGAAIPVSAGFNNMVRVTLPANYDGTISIRFSEPVSWRIAELVSLVTLLGALGYLLWKTTLKGKKNAHLD